MYELFINNSNIILVILMVYILIQKFISKVSWRIKWRLQRTIICKNKKINSIIKSFCIYSLIICLITLQRYYNFIYVGKEDSYITLIIGILTLYGIFYVFIQFAISYALQNDSDKFWGRSKTKSLLINNIEYKLFNSNTFKFLMFNTVIFSLLNIETLFNIELLKSYTNFIKALWEVSIFIIVLLYIFLFIRSILVMQTFFDIQERNDFRVREVIKNDIFELYKSLFIKSYKNRDDYFLNILDNDLRALKSNEKVEMLYKVLFKSVYELKKNQLNQIKKIDKGRKIRQKKIDTYKFRAYDLMNMFNDLWIYLQEEKIEMDFEKLLSIFRLQDDILFNQIYICCLGNNEKIIEKLVLIYNDHMRYSYRDTCSYFRVPSYIWNKISNYQQLVKLNRYINQREATKILIHKYQTSSHIKLSDNENTIIHEYENYLKRILDKSKLFFSELKKDDFIYLIGSYNIDEGRMKIPPTIQEQIYLYILNLEYKCSNKEYIMFLFGLVEYKYILAFIFYTMLYTGRDAYSKWQDDILFLRRINSNYYNDSKINSKVNIDFICKTISNSNISHRISNNLIKWIINNIKNELSEYSIKKCIDTKYMTYAKLLKFIYIFGEYDYFYQNFSNINIKKLINQEWNDWRIIFLSEILMTPNLLKEEFFFTHQYKFYEEFLKPMMPKYIYKTNDFRMFYINFSFSINKQQFSNIILEEGFVGKGIFEFLILKIDDEYYRYLLSNNKLSKVFKKKVKDIINNSNVSIECYIDSLINKASECDNNHISIMKRERIIYKLQKLLY